jgi:hypothetical protein
VTSLAFVPVDDERALPVSSTDVVVAGQAKPDEFVLGSRPPIVHGLNSVLTVVDGGGASGEPQFPKLSFVQ